MKQGRALPEVLKELQHQNNMKQDFIGPAQAFMLEPDGRTFRIRHQNTGAEETFGTTDLFHRQVGSTLGIPAKYYDLMRQQKPELLAENVNSWFADREQSYMIRSMDYGSGRVARALLSDRYRRIDNLEVAAAVLPLFAGKEEMEVVSTEVSPNRLYLKIVNKRLEMEVVPGDYVQAGVVISNSEVGLGAVSVQPLVYRLVCTNGMVVNDFGERRAHVGRAVKALEDSFQLYSDETMEAEDKAFMLKLRDTTLAALEEARFAQIVGRFQESTQARITGRVQDVIELTGKAYDLNQPEQDSILNYLIQGGDLSLYGLSNAIGRRSTAMCHEHHYPRGYRDDEELYVYDQCCDNCCNAHCPMEYPMSLEEYLEECGCEPDGYDPEEEALKMAEVTERRKEDAILKEDEPTWCIYWKGRRDCR